MLSNALFASQSRFLRLLLSRGTAIVAKIGPVVVDLKLERSSESSASHTIIITVVLLLLFLPIRRTQILQVFKSCKNPAILLQDLNSSYSMIDLSGSSLRSILTI